MRKKPKPYFFSSNGIKEHIMAKKKAPRKGLTPKQVAKMIEDWDDNSYEDFAELFGVSTSTIINMGKEVRAQSPSHCPVKGGAKRSDTVAAALKLVEPEE